MENDTDGADNCQPTTSNPNTNVRTKVSSWVTSFVSEMRTKSPAVVQRWVDSLPNEDITILPADETLENSSEFYTEETVTKSTNKKSECISICVNDNNESIAVKHQPDSEYNINCDLVTDSVNNSISTSDCSHKRNEANDTENRFWHKGSSILLAFRRRGSLHQNSETDDLISSVQLNNCDESTSITPQSRITDTTTTTTTATAPSTPTPTINLLNKSKLNELYDKLNISRKRYNFIKERKMEAKNLLSNAKSRFLATANQPNVDDDVESSDTVPNVHMDEEKSDNNLIVCTTDAATEASGTTSHVCDTVEMDISTDEFSRLSQSNDMLSADDDDSFNTSMPSINDVASSTHLHVNRKIAMADIGRSTSDNPRLRNKFYLADIGRSFSEHQDDDAIMIGERNISAPTSSIAIQNNNKSNGNFYERRAYSVSPTQRNLKRGTLSRDHSLSEGSRHRHQLSKGSSFQSDSSHCSSVESLLDARKPDPEAILRHLGFGPAHQEDLLSRIPKRFLKPSQVPGIDTETFMRQQQIATNLHEQSILGYRGLVGNPHVLPSVIVARLMERFQLSDDKNTKLFDSFNDERPMSAPPTPGLRDLSDNTEP